MAVYGFDHEVDVGAHRRDALAQQARQERDRRINAVRWRLERYEDEKKLGFMPTDSEDTIENILMYVQALRDVPQQDGFPEKIDWPAEPQEARDVL